MIKSGKIKGKKDKKKCLTYKKEIVYFFIYKNVS